MKQLFWKEWHELRLLPLLAAVSIVPLAVGVGLLLSVISPGFTELDVLFLTLLLDWVVFALLSAAPLFAQEVSGGNLVFLNALPISRHRLWWVKAMTGFGSAASCLLLSGLVLVAFVRAVSSHSFFASIPWEWPLDFLGIALLFFSCALAVSPFVGRPLSAMTVASLVALTYCVCLSNGVDLYVNTHVTLYGMYGVGAGTHALCDPRILRAALVSLGIAAFTVISYYTFTRGESLRSPKRFRVGAAAGLASLAAVGLVLGMGHWASLW